MEGIIKSYGLFWSAEDVYWGGSGYRIHYEGKPGGHERGGLLGMPVTNVVRCVNPIDFRDQSGIYVLYDQHKMVYVGQTGSGKQKLLTRLTAHRRDSLAGRWNAFSFFGLQGLTKHGNLSKATPTKATANLKVALNHIEGILIAAAEPTLNKQSGRFGKDLEFSQVRDKRLGPTESQMIKEIWKCEKEQYDKRRAEEGWSLAGAYIGKDKAMEEFNGQAIPSISDAGKEW